MGLVREEVLKLTPESVSLRSTQFHAGEIRYAGKNNDLSEINRRRRGSCDTGAVPALSGDRQHTWVVRADLPFSKEKK